MMFDRGRSDVYSEERLEVSDSAALLGRTGACVLEEAPISTATSMCACGNKASTGGKCVICFLVGH